MTVKDLIAKLGTFDPDLPVHLSWSHGARPGEVTDVSLYTVYGKPHFVEIEGEEE